MASEQITETSVANVALSYTGEGSVSSIDDPAAKAARTIRAIFGQVRRECLALANWSFALRTKALTERAANSNYPLVNFANAFPIGSDLLRLDEVWLDGAIAGLDSYSIEQGPNGEELLTDASEVTIRGVFDHKIPARWSPLFVKLMAAELGLRVNPELNGDKGQRDRATRDRRDALKEARSANLQKKAGRSQPQGPWTLARRTPYGRTTNPGEHPS